MSLQSLDDLDAAVLVGEVGHGAHEGVEGALLGLWLKDENVLAVFEEEVALGVQVRGLGPALQGDGAAHQLVARVVAVPVASVSHTVSHYLSSGPFARKKELRVLTSTRDPMSS